MKTIIHGQRYDTETATLLIERDWATYHPNLSGGEPSLHHERKLYKTKNGALFAFEYDDSGYGRDQHTGATGAFVKTTKGLRPFDTPEEALMWAEEEGFSAAKLEEAFGDPIEDA